MMDTDRGRVKQAVRARPRSERRLLALWPVVAVLVVAAMFFLVLPVAILVVAGMLPTFVAWVTDGRRHRYLAPCLASMNLVGVLPIALDFWRAGADMAGLARLLSDPVPWLVMFAAAGVGWVIYLVVPPLYTGIVTLNLNRRREFVAQRQRLIEDEWELGGADLGEGGP